MAVVRRKDHRFYVNKGLQETTYGTALTPVCDTELLMGANFQGFKPVSRKVLNGGMTTGREGASSQLIDLSYYEGTLTWDWVYPNDLAFILTYGLGKCTSTQNGSLGQYEHDIKEAPSFTLPAFSCIEKLALGVYKQYTGCFVRSLTFRYGKDGVSLSADVIAQKQDAGLDPSLTVLTDEPGILVSSTPSTAQEANLYVGTGGVEESYDGDIDTADIAATTTSYQARMYTFSITIDNGIDIENLRTWASSNIIARPERGVRTVSGEIVLDADSTYDLEKYINSVTTYAVEWEWDSKVVAGSEGGSNYSAQIIVPDAAFNDVTYSHGTGGRRIATFPFTALDTDAVNGRVLATVWNEVAAYAA